MPRKSKIDGATRSDLIREYLKDHPSDGPKKVAAALKSQGIDVSEALVSSVKYAREPQADQPITADDLIELKALADKLGGIAKLREAVDKLEKVFHGNPSAN